MGAHVSADGVSYRAWAPEREIVEVEIAARGGATTRLAMTKDVDGYHVVSDPRGQQGDRYAFFVEGAGPFPDPASRFQPDGVHAASEVIDPKAFSWTDNAWRRPAFRDLVIYELHVGTFTAEGTFQAIIGKLPELRELGITAIEIMPIGDFPGGRNWGYDGVSIYAPARAYGKPDDLRALVDAAHGDGIAVILDVVYNHLGPDGNYLSAFSDRFFNEHQTPWGRAFNFDGELSGPVRQFFLQNPAYWMDQFHIDGFRFDATHEVIDTSEPHLFAEITDAVHALGGYAIAEDPRNDSQLIRLTNLGGNGFDAVWADDFHHAVRVGLTGQRESYYENFTGSPQELIETLQHGWLYRGQKLTAAGSKRGTKCRELPPTAFVHCISNHDQTGNRALGERLHQCISEESYRAVSALLCLTPYTPMLFMGQEWAASSPFCFFTEHNAELGRLVTEGRRREFAEFKDFQSEAARARIPDPQDTETFTTSKLKWDERVDGPHAAMLQLYRDFLRLRAESPGFRPATRESWEVRELSWGAGAISIADKRERYLVVFALTDGCAGKIEAAGKWSLVLSSEEERFGGRGAGFNEELQTCSFPTPETLVLRAS